MCWSGWVLIPSARPPMYAFLPNVCHPFLLHDEMVLDNGGAGAEYGVANEFHCVRLMRLRWRDGGWHTATANGTPYVGWCKCLDHFLRFHTSLTPIPDRSMRKINGATRPEGMQARPGPGPGPEPEPLILVIINTNMDAPSHRNPRV